MQPALANDEVTAIPVFFENNEPVLAPSKVVANKGTDNLIGLKLGEEIYLETGELEH